MTQMLFRDKYFIVGATTRIQQPLSLDYAALAACGKKSPNSS
jgi:hypothetical protein